MKDKITEEVKRNIGGDEQRVHDMQVHHQGVTYKHVLLPVWVSSFRYNDKVFRVVVNARNGAVAGDRPYSGWKIFFFVLMIVAIITGIIVLIVMLTKKPAPPPERTMDVGALVAPAPALAHVPVALEPLAGYHGFEPG
jgi:hypothetical protein